MQHASNRTNTKKELQFPCCPPSLQLVKGGFNNSSRFKISIMALIFINYIKMGDVYGYRTFLLNAALELLCYKAGFSVCFLLPRKITMLQKTGTLFWLKRDQVLCFYGYGSDPMGHIHMKWAGEGKR